MATFSPKPPDLGIPTNQNFESTQLETALEPGVALACCSPLLGSGMGIHSTARLRYLSTSHYMDANLLRPKGRCSAHLLAHRG
jgi:hypothetical protein